MTDNEALVRRMVEFHSQMDADGIRTVLHSDARHTAPGSDFGADMEGRDTIVAYFRNDVFPAFDRLRFEVVYLWEDRERSVVVIEWRSHLWPKTGKQYSNTGAFVVVVRDGQVFWVREYFDTQKTHAQVT